MVEADFWGQALAALGEVVILLLLVTILVTMIIASLVLLSIKHGRFYFPRLVRVCFDFMEGRLKAACKIMGLKESEFVIYFINLHNQMSEKAFSQIPMEDRAIFLPHCLRSSRCPAILDVEGLECTHCGGCELDQTVKELEAMGYKVFIVPGSTFIARMVKKYFPKAIIGVGCLREIKDGLEFADKLGLVAMGVVNKTDGCVETRADLPELMLIASLGAPKN